MNNKLPSNLGLDMVRVTEAAALTAGRWMGLRQPDQADRAAKEAMVKTLNNLEINGVIVVGEEEKLGIHSSLDSGQRVGTGEGPSLDLVFDPIDGTELLAVGHSDAISGVETTATGARHFPAWPKIACTHFGIGLKSTGGDDDETLNL